MQHNTNFMDNTLNIGLNGEQVIITFADKKGEKLSQQLSALSKKGTVVTIGNNSITLSGERQKDTYNLNLMVLNHVAQTQGLDPAKDKQDAVARLEQHPLIVGLSHSFGKMNNDNLTYAFVKGVLDAPFKLLSQLVKEENVYVKEATKPFYAKIAESKDRVIVFKSRSGMELTQGEMKRAESLQKQLGAAK